MYFLVLLLDVKIMAEVKGFFQSYFLAGNLFVQGLCMAAMFWSLDRVYAALGIFGYMPVVLIVSCLDAFPFHLFGENRLYKTVCLIVAIGQESLNGVTMLLGHFKQMPKGNVYDPQLFTGTYVETKLSSIALTCITNIRVSNFWVVFSVTSSAIFFFWFWGGTKKKKLNTVIKVFKRIFASVPGQLKLKSLYLFSWSAWRMNRLHTRIAM